MANKRMILSERDRIAKYTSAYFTERGCCEIEAYHHKQLRADQWACIGYALGYKSYASVCRALKITEPDARWTKPISDLDKLNISGYRDPKFIVDIGAGRGELAVAFLKLGIECVAVDPSPGAAQLRRTTMRKWDCPSGYTLINLSMLKALRGMVRMGIEPDTIIFCETIEHIRAMEFTAAWPVVVSMLRQTSGLAIIANWIDNHPIRPDRTGYDHITHINDHLYDKLSNTAEEVVFRQGSHLVLRF